jgi:hypothetical protein
MISATRGRIKGEGLNDWNVLNELNGSTGRGPVNNAG